MSPAIRAGWWKGRRGEGYVVGQVVLLALVFFGPRTTPSLPTWPRWLSGGTQVAGPLLMAAGAALLVSGLVALGRRNLTPLPYPTKRCVLRQTGPYALVRHPMYAGGIILAYGWALTVSGWLTLAYATALLVFADLKASREERWLVDMCPDYAAYQRRVSKLIPFVH